MSAVVLDASMTMAWFFEGELTDTARQALWSVTQEGAVVPAIWHAEIANALAMGLRRNRIDEAFCTDCFNDLRQMDIVTDPETNARLWTETMGLATRHRLSVYDAAYLELAGRLGLPLATLDRALAHAANVAGVNVFGGAA